MVDFSSRQGRTRVFTAGVVPTEVGIEDGLITSRRRNPAENAGLGQNMPFPDGHELIKGLPITLEPDDNHHGPE